MSGPAAATRIAPAETSSRGSLGALVPQARRKPSRLRPEAANVAGGMSESVPMVTTCGDVWLTCSNANFTGIARPDTDAAFAKRLSVASRASALGRSEERRVGKSVDLGGRRIIKNKKTA